MNKVKKTRPLAFFLALTILLSSLPAHLAMTASAESDPFMGKLHELLDEPDMEYRPATRWWMAEGLHTDETIIDGVKEIYDMGMSNIEIVCRDGGAKLPDDLDPELWPDGTTAANLYSWGSEEWKHDTELVIQEATKYGMGFSLTSGTNWGNANLPRKYLMPDDDGAGKSLGYKIQVVENGETFDGVLPRSYRVNPDLTKRQDLVAVVAMKRDPSSDATLVDSGNTVDTIAFDQSHPDQVMVYDDTATQVLTDQVTLNGVPVTDETMKDPTGEAAFTLNWTPPDNGTWDIFCFWLQATGQSPTPSADVNYTINYVDPYGMEEFLKFYENVFFDDELKEIIRANGKGEIYMDSIEISTTNGQTGQFWGYTLLDEFKERRGYDLTPYLPYIIMQPSRAEFTKYHTAMLNSDGVLEHKIRSDLYDTMTEMYIENVLTPLKTWLNDEMNMKLRAEVSFNLPYELTTPVRAVDYVETESLEFGEQIETFRKFAGAANVYGRRLSSETGALSGENYAHGMERYMRMINTQFAGGVQHTVWHGYSSLSGPKPEDDGTWTRNYWPGSEVMATSFSDRLGPRQPSFQHYGDLMTKIARDQAVLQQGKAQVDLAIMQTDYYFPHDHNESTTNVDTMRNRKANFMKDLSLQDAGYTYNYFAPENLEFLEQEGIADYREGEGLIPDNAGYQAVIVYEENLRVESAQKLLELAQKGLPIVIVNGLTVRYTNTKGISNWGQTVGLSSSQAANNPAIAATSKLHEKAAVYTAGNDGREDELAEVMGKLKALNNVVECSSKDLPTDPNNPDPETWGYDDQYFYNKTGILEALQELGVRPRAEFTKTNKNYFTVTRKTDDTLYLWAYNFMSDDEFKPQPVTFDIENDININVSEAGKPYVINTWTGEIEELAAYNIEDGRTSFDLTLEPGETTVIALDLKNSGDGLHAVSTDADKALLEDGVVSVYATESGTYTTQLSDGTVAITEIEAPDSISLDEWDLTVEDWTRGELVDITENRGLGYTTVESYWTTKKTPIKVGRTALIPWKDIPSVGPAVSGVGTYTTTFELPADWSDNNGAYLDIESLCRNTAYVWVNGQRAKGLDFVTGNIDVSELLQPGVNTMKVEVASSLRNRMIDLGYAGVNPNSPYLPGDPGPAGGGRYNIRMPAADYGMVGNVVLNTYTKMPVQVTESNKSILSKVIDYAEQAKASGEYDNAIESVQKSFDAALENAKAVANNAAATQEEVDSAWQTLLNEIHKLGFIAGDKTELASLIAAAEEINAELDRYVETGKAEFTAALEAAQGVYQDGDAMQAEINETADNLLNAMLNLRYKADKSILEAVLAQASGIDTSLYTAETAASFLAAQTEATKVLDDEQADQQAVNAAADKLQKAIDALTPAAAQTESSLVQGDPTATTAGSTPKTGDSFPAAGAAAVLLLGAACLLFKRSRRG